MTMQHERVGVDQGAFFDAEAAMQAEVVAGLPMDYDAARAELYILQPSDPMAEASVAYRAALHRYSTSSAATPPSEADIALVTQVARLQDIVNRRYDDFPKA